MSDIMRVLASEWVVGYAVSISVCVISYLLYSILLVVSCRRVGYDVGVSGMIPIWNIVVLIKRAIFVHKKNKLIPEDEEIEL